MKFRHFTDLRRLNTYFETPSYRNEDIRDAMKLIKGKDMFVTIDIKDGFHHVPIATAYIDHLGFRWHVVFTDGRYCLLVYLVRHTSLLRHYAQCLCTCPH